MIIAFIGDNGHAREQAAREFIDGFVGVHGTVAIDRFSGEELDQTTLIDAISSIPFLSERRLVIVRDLSSNKPIAEQFETLVDSVADAVDFVIIEGHVDGRSKYLSQLKKRADVREFTHLEGEDLVDWVIAQTKSLDGSINRASAQLLVERIGTNQQLIANELAKLVLYQPEITESSIKSLTAYTPQSSIFAMLDAAFAGKAGEALKLYSEQRVQGMEPQAILGMVVWQLHSLAVVKMAGTMSPNDIASSAKMSPFVVLKNQTTARRVSDAKLLELFEQAISIDTMLKTSSVNADDAVRTLITSFA